MILPLWMPAISDRCWKPGVAYSVGRPRRRAVAGPMQDAVAGLQGPLADDRSHVEVFQRPQPRPLRQ